METCVQAGTADELLADALGRLLAQTAGALRAARGSGALDPDPLRRSLRPLVGELLAEPECLLRLLNTRFAPPLLQRRAVGCALLMGVFGRALGFGRKMLEELMLGALLMDLGKVSVPVAILAKPGKLTPVEMGYACRHVERGLAMLRLTVPHSPTLAAILRSHHERLDGTGYPEGLVGTAIPLAARMAAIVDTYDALTLDRPYARGLASPEALAGLREAAGRTLDADLVENFCQALQALPHDALTRRC
ncbi:MAG: HD domain-containing protein [Chromatiales bacterium]|nr:HD domain-containing protein [Chromatiales bacterium]